MELSIIDSSLLLFVAVVILIFFVVEYWLKIWLFLLDHGSNVSVAVVENSSDDSFFVDVIAAANARDNGSISIWLDFIESGSTIVVDGDDVDVIVCGLFAYKIEIENKFLCMSKFYIHTTTTPNGWVVVTFVVLLYCLCSEA